MPSNPSKRQPRLKESCDRCSVAKVRCNKDKPSCSRCAQKGLQCGYSYSRRAGRRTTTGGIHNMAAMLESSDSSCHSSASSSSHSPSPASISPNLGASPGDLSVSDDSDIFNEMWSYPQQQQQPSNHVLHQMPQQQQFNWNQDLYTMNAAFDQTFNFPLPTTDHSFIAPLNALDASLLQQSYPHLDPVNMHRTSTSSTSSISDNNNADNVQNELANLTDFAESLERKYDAVVRQRMQYRDFGSVEMEPERLGGEGVGSPDMSELSLYYSLAELKRRLTWLREDVGNLVVQ